MSRKWNPPIERGLHEALQTEAVKEVVVLQLGEAMKACGVSKAGMAKLLRTSRTQVNRILDPYSDITISSLQRAAALVGRQVKLELV